MVVEPDKAEGALERPNLGNSHNWGRVELEASNIENDPVLRRSSFGRLFNTKEIKSQKVILYQTWIIKILLANHMLQYYNYFFSRM